MIRFNLVKFIPFASLLFRSWLISNLYEAMVFICRHRRLPRFRKTRYLNDLLFRLRATESDYVLRAFTSDKEFVKLYVRGATGLDLGIPTLGVIRDASEIGAYRFPPNAVVKPTHMSGHVVFVGADGKVSEHDRHRMKAWMRQNFGVMTGERHYLRLEPKIIIEPWLKLNDGYCNDYKLHVYGGKAHLVEVAVSRFGDGGGRWMYFDRHWQRLRLASRDYPAAPEWDAGGWLRPKLLDRMLSVAETIGREFEYVRVDFYTDCGETLFIGEISHIPANTRERFDPAEDERFFVESGADAVRQAEGDVLHGQPA